MRRITTEDGYRFTEQPDGTWTDGDMVYDNLEQITGAVGIKTYITGEGEPWGDFHACDHYKEVWEFYFFEPSDDRFGRLSVVADSESKAWEAFNEIGGLIHKGQWLMKFLGVQPCKR